MDTEHPHCISQDVAPSHFKVSQPAERPENPKVNS